MVVLQLHLFWEPSPEACYPLHTLAHPHPPQAPSSPCAASVHRGLPSRKSQDFPARASSDEVLCGKDGADLGPVSFGGYPPFAKLICIFYSTSVTLCGLVTKDRTWTALHCIKVLIQHISTWKVWDLSTENLLWPTLATHDVLALQMPFMPFPLLPKAFTIFYNKTLQQKNTSWN